MTNSEQDPSRELFDRLRQTAATLQENRVMTDEQIATAFTSVGVAIVTNALGPVSAAEWIRDVADSVEAQSELVQ